MLRKSHRPADAVCELRSYVRNRQRLVKDWARCVQHMQKALQQMNVKLDSVLSDVAGKSGMAIIEAIVSGERNAEVLAALCDGRAKKNESEIALALYGHWRDEHLFALRQALESYRHYTGQLAALEVRILTLVEQLAAHVTEADTTDDGRTPVKTPRGAWQQHLHKRLWDLFGTDLTAIPGVGMESALVLLSELGHDFSEFGSSRQFSQWLSLAPGTNISGGKRLPEAKGRGTQVAGQPLRMAAMSLKRSQCALGDKHRRRCSRMERPRAFKAIAHELARIIYAMVTRRTEYLGMDPKTMAEQVRSRLLRRLHAEAKKLRVDLVGMVKTWENTLNQSVA